MRSRIDAALRGTGISTSEVVARIETGASNAALEHQWIADDLSKVAEARDLNLERRADLEQARDILNDVHVALATLLERENVLRRDIAQNYLAILDRRPEDAQLIHLIIGSFAAVGLMLSLALSGSALTRFGQTHWQSAREMKANGFFGAPGTGFTQRGWKGVARSCPKHISSTTTSSSLSRLMSSFVIKERARRMIYRSHSLS